MALDSPNTLSRRRFLRVLSSSGAVAVGGIVLAACGAAPTTSNPTAAGESPTNVPAATSAPAPAASEPTTAPAANTGPVTVSVMHKRGEFSEDAQKAFEAANPNIKIEFLEDDPTKLFAMFAAGNPPDLFRTQAPDIPQLVGRNLLLDLTPYFNSSTLINVKDLAPANSYFMANGPLEIGTGKIYGMLKDWGPDMLLYANKELFEKAGVPLPDTTKALTYADVAELAGKLRKEEENRTTVWGYNYEQSWVDRYWMDGLAEQGKKLYSDDFLKMDLVKNDAARQLAQYHFDLAKKNLVSNPLNPTGWFGEDFTKGQLAIAQYGFWFSAMAESDVTKSKVVVLPAPTWTGVQRNPTIAATGMVMSKTTKNPDAAWKVFEWYNAGDVAIDRFKSGWGVPSFVSKYDLIPTETDFQKQAKGVLDAELKHTTAPMQFNPYLTQFAVSSSWSKHLEEALRGKITFDELLQNVENETNQAIQDGKDRMA